MDPAAPGGRREVQLLDDVQGDFQGGGRGDQCQAVGPQVGEDRRPGAGVPGWRDTALPPSSAALLLPGRLLAVATGFRLRPAQQRRLKGGGQLARVGVFKLRQAEDLLRPLHVQGSDDLLQGRDV